MDNVQGFAALIKAYRDDHDLTQQEVGQRLGYSAPAIAAWEHGRRLPLRSECRGWHTCSR